jgi:SAM-dependent methyltransferase
MNALVVGRFHAVTRAQWEWMASLAREPIARVYGVITSADHHHTRRNPLEVELRERLLRPALERCGRPVELVRIEDIPDSEHWVQHVVTQLHGRIAPGDTIVYSANRDVRGLFEAAGFRVVAPEQRGPTPSELVQRVVDGRSPWRDDASPETAELYADPARVEALRQIFRQTLVTDDGELGHARDFASYGAQMDAALRQKLEDLLPWVRPGCIVDKGCGTGSLLVELAKRFPSSRLVGVDLSREFLRRCDENTYASEDVDFVAANIIERNVEAGSATTIIYSSVMHEVHSYTGYDPRQIDRALANAFDELEPGGRVLVRDGVSPAKATWRLRLLDAATRETFSRFAVEFRHGRGVAFERLSQDVVQLSSHDANEFLCKKDYQANWHIEVHEEFGVWTVPEWKQALERVGFLPLHLHEYVNPWIAEHRYASTVVLTDADDASLPWPATNCVVVGRKPMG